MLATVVTVVASSQFALASWWGSFYRTYFLLVAQIFRLTSTASPDGRSRTYVVEGH